MVADSTENHLDWKEGAILTEKRVWTIYSKSDV